MESNLNTVCPHMELINPKMDAKFEKKTFLVRSYIFYYTQSSNFYLGKFIQGFI